MFTDTSLQPGLVNPSRNDEHLISGFALQLVDYLTRQLSRPDLAHGVLATARRFKSLDEDEQWKNLPATYLVFEQYLVELDPCKKFLREQLREIVKTRFGLLVDALPEFSLIFQPSAKQEVLLCTKFLSAVLDEAASFIWGDLREQVRVTGLWLHGSLQDPMPPLVQACVSSVPKDDHGWVALLKTFSRSMFLLFQRRFGERSTSGIFSRAYGQIADTYIALETFPAVIDLLPEILLDREKTALFHLGRIRKSVTERTDQLHEINEQLLSKNKELAVMRAELNKANDRLELRVKQRTSELERANERLRGEIDERHRAELALRLSQEYARNIIDSSLDMIIAV
ncbi:MAG TPA: hypothetical protein VI758_03625, partial [Bacteroidota bacterium]